MACRPLRFCFPCAPGATLLASAGRAPHRSAKLAGIKWTRYRSPALAGSTGAGRQWTALMISLLLIPFEIDAGDAEVRMAQLALDVHEWDAFSGHRDRMGVA